MIDRKKLGYEITLWDNSERSCPDCDGHIITQNLKTLDEIYSNGICGSELGRTRIVISENLESFLEGEESKEFRFYNDAPRLDELTETQLIHFYEEIKHEIIDTFSPQNIQRRILPIFTKKYLEFL